MPAHVRGMWQIKRPDSFVPETRITLAEIKLIHCHTTFVAITEEPIEKTTELNWRKDENNHPKYTICNTLYYLTAFILYALVKQEAYYKISECELHTVLSDGQDLKHNLIGKRNNIWICGGANSIQVLIIFEACLVFWSLKHITMIFFSTMGGFEGKHLTLFPSTIWLQSTVNYNWERHTPNFQMLIII